jgi:hypothetical protein
MEDMVEQPVLAEILHVLEQLLSGARYLTLEQVALPEIINK